MSRKVEAKWVIVYVDKQGHEPFTEWINGLGDVKGRQRILARVSRLEHGNFGDCQPVGEGVSELRMFFGPGYRVYIGEEGKNIVLLICGGDKNTQSQDIETAKAYWKEHTNNA